MGGAVAMAETAWCPRKAQPFYSAHTSGVQKPGAVTGLACISAHGLRLNDRVLAFPGRPACITLTWQEKSCWNIAENAAAWPQHALGFTLNAHPC
jgi:hypothetical protein